MQNDFVDGALGSADAQAIVPNVVKKINDWKGMVIATKDTHSTLSYDNTLEGQRLPVQHCIKDTLGWELNGEVKKALEEHGAYLGTLEKRSFGSNVLPEIVFDLATRTVDNSAYPCYDECEAVDEDYETRITRRDAFVPDMEVTLVGLCTNICVLANAMALRNKYPNMKITVDSTCCAGTSFEAHASSLTAMKSVNIDIE